MDYGVFGLQMYLVTCIGLKKIIWKKKVFIVILIKNLRIKNEIYVGKRENIANV